MFTSKFLSWEGCFSSVCRNVQVYRLWSLVVSLLFFDDFLLFEFIWCLGYALLLLLEKWLGSWDFSHKFFTQFFHTNFLHSFFIQIFHINFSHKFFTQVFYTVFSHKFFTQFFHTNFSHNFFTQVFHTSFSHNFFRPPNFFWSKYFLVLSDRFFYYSISTHLLSSF